MKKLFGRRKKDGEAGQQQAAAPPPPTAAPAVPPLPLQQLPELGLGTPLGPTARTLSGAPSGRSLGRSMSGMSSGRRSARRPRELIQPEQVDAGSDGEGVGSAGLGQEGPGWAAQQERQEAEDQQERDLALAWQLALGAQADQQPPPPLLAPHPQQQAPAAAPGSQRAAAPSPLAAQPSFMLDPQQQAALAQQFHSLPVRQLAAQPLPLHESLPLPRRPQRRVSSRLEAAQEDVALAAALADLQFAAQQQEMAAKLAAQNEAAYQAAIEAALEESMVTVNYDDLLRDIQFWIRDLDGAAGDVNSALVEARRNRSEIEARVVAADPDDEQGLHELLWYSEQYPLMEQRLADIGARVAPVNDAVKALRDLHDYIRQEQPPLADAESIRDAVIAKLFEDLSNQGLDANHPFGAYGGTEAAEAGTSAAPMERQPSRLRSLLSLGGKRSRKASNPRGGDLRDMVRQMIEDAKKMPPPPPLPVDYSSLLADLRRWIEALHGVKYDVQEALEDVHHRVEDQKEAVDAADPADQEEWHRHMWLSQELPAMRARLKGVQEQVEPPTQAAAQALQDFIEHIEMDKPPLAEAESMRAAAISTLAQRLVQRRLPPLPPNPQPEEVRSLAAQAIEEAKRLPAMPPFVDYTALLEDLKRWIAELEGAAADVDKAQQEARQQTAGNSGQLGQTNKGADPEGWWRLNWLSEQYPIVEARLAVVVDETSPTRTAAAALRDLRHAIEDQHQAALVKPPLAELEAVRDRTLASMAEDMARCGLDTQAAIAASAGGASSSSGAAGIRGMVQQLIEEARRLPPMPPMPVDYSGLLASVHRWIEELQGTAADVEQAQAEASREQSDVAAWLAAAVQLADPAGWHRLSWLVQELPLIASRLGGVAGKAAPGAAAVQELQQLAQRIESEKPPLAEATAARDATVSTLLASLGQAGLAVPAGAGPSEVRGSVQREIEEAKRLPAMPAFVDYSALLEDLQQWVEELQGAAADVAAAQQEASAAVADASNQLAATAAEDKEGLHRLGWLTEQLPLAEQRLAAVSSGLEAPAAAATAALQQLRQRIEQECVPALVKPPLAELEVERDAAVATLAAELAQRGLPEVPELPSTADVRSSVRQAIEEARRLPAMPLMPVDYSALLADIQSWIAALEAASADVAAAQQEAGSATADTAAAAAAAEPTDLPALHRLAWLSQECPLVEERLEGIAAKLAPAGEAVDALQQLVKRIEEEQPPLEEATAARNQAITALVDGLAAGGLTAQEPAGMRGSVQQAIEAAKRLPDMPPFVDYIDLLADLQRWVEALAATAADVSAARQAAAAATADASSQLEASDRSDAPATYRLLWLSEQLPLVEQRLAAVAKQLAPAAAASDALQQLRQRIEEECVPALVKPPLAELEAERDAAVAALAAELAQHGLPALPALPTSEDVRSAAQQAVEEAQHLPEMPPFVDYSDLLADIQRWVEELDSASADVGTAQQDAAHAQERTAAEMAAADKGDREGWHRLLWLSEQQPLAEARLAAVGTQVGPLAAAAAGLQELAQTIEQEHAVSLAQPPLEEMEAVLDALLASMAEQLAQQGLAGVPEAPSTEDVRSSVQQAVEEAKQLPAMPPFVDYSALLADIREWVEQLQGAAGDVSSAQQEAEAATAAAGAQLAAADQSDKEALHRLAWLAEQRPLVEQRLAAVGGRVTAPADAAVAALQALAERIEEEYYLSLAKPPLAEVEGERDAAVAALAGALDLPALTPASSARDVRGEVRRLIEEALSLPEMPGYVNYEPVQRDIQQWIEALRGAVADVDGARQAAGVATTKAAAELSAADRGDKEGLHRLTWLAEQRPLVEQRLVAVQGRVAAPAATATAALQALLDSIESSKPPLMEVVAGRDAAVAALLGELALDALPPAPRGTDMRSGVQRLIEEVQRLPKMPPYVSYDALLADLQQWIEALEGCAADVAAAQQEVGAKAAETSAQLEQTSKEEDREGHHRLHFLSEQYPLVQQRLAAVAGKAAPAGEAAQSLRALVRQVEGDSKPTLPEAEGTRDAAIKALVVALGKQGVHVAAASAAVREAIQALIKKARRIPPVPTLPPVYNMPAPKPSPRPAPAPPKFNAPILSAPRLRKKSRGVKPSAEDAIKRDPRVIALYNELSRGASIVASTVAWETQRAELAAAAGGSPPPRGGTPGSARRGTPTRPASAAGTPRRPGSASPAPTTPSPRPVAGMAPAASPPAASPAAAAAERELTEEEAAAYLPTLPARGAAVAAFEPRSLQEVSDFVADVKAQGGDAPRSGHAAASFPGARWRLLVDAAAVFDQLLDMCDTLTKWECRPQAGVVAEAHRLASYMEDVSRAAGRVMYPHDPLRVRMAKAGVPWDAALLTDLRWAAQRAAAALMAFALEQAESTINAKRFHTGAVLQPLGSAAIGAFKVHQFCGGFNQEAGRLFDALHEQTVHYARMMDPSWFRSSKLVRS